ncbi:MAG: MATE family efflux transporter [Clostridia bacterium]|nr:MATE family efflux transporter [Clostridia bacterium]
MDIQLSEHFDVKKILKFTLPSIVMILFTSIYGVIDGLFVSNFAGEEALAAINLIWPSIMIIGVIGFMMGTGGSALVSKTLGEGEVKKANRYFSMIVYFTMISAIVLGVVGIFVMKPLAIFLKADGETLINCVKYGSVLCGGLICFMLQNLFQSFLVVAERPDLGMKVTIAAGVCNMILDFVFIYLCKWGVIGAALATVAGQAVAGFVPIIYFLNPNNSSPINLIKTNFEFKPIIASAYNGLSEMLGNISMSLVNMLYNYQLMKLAGIDGVNAYGIVMYIDFVFVSTYIGYSIGTAPIVGYHYGAQNTDELKSVLNKSLKIIFTFSSILFLIAFCGAGVFAKIFVSYDEELFRLTAHALRVGSWCYLLAGFNIYASSFFTALNNGTLSAIISFARTILFQVGFIFLLPLFWGIEGIWLSRIFADVCSMLLTLFILIKNNKRYNYF